MSREEVEDRRRGRGGKRTGEEGRGEERWDKEGSGRKWRGGDRGNELKEKSHLSSMSSALWWSILSVKTRSWKIMSSTAEEKIGLDSTRLGLLRSKKIILD